MTFEQEICSHVWKFQAGQVSEVSCGHDLQHENFISRLGEEKFKQDIQDFLTSKGLESNSAAFMSRFVLYARTNFSMDLDQLTENFGLMILTLR